MERMINIAQYDRYTVFREVDTVFFEKSLCCNNVLPCCRGYSFVKIGASMCKKLRYKYMSYKLQVASARLPVTGN